MREVIGSVIAVLENQAKDNAVTLTVREINITHNSLTGSTVHLRRVLSNIITNAIKYNRKDGTVEISCVETDRKMPDGRIIYRITCADTGIGMSRDFQKHMYEQFTQENAAGELSHHGTGLGLPIVKSLVEKMDGTMDCKSKRGEGTVFTIELPFAIDKSAAESKNDGGRQTADDMHAVGIGTVKGKITDDTNSVDAEGTTNAASDVRTTSPATPGAAPASLDGVSVLVVEDNELNMEITEFILEDEGMKVTKAWNGDEAVKIFADSEPGTYSVILMDMMMPVMDGLTATRNIRALDRSDAKEIPIIAMTANVFEEDVNASKEAGMNAHLAKPIDEKQLIKTIEELL
jgi:CheY-like chemotaxis protein